MNSTKKIYIPKFYIKTSSSFFNKSNNKLKNRNDDNSNCNSVENIKNNDSLKFITERNSSKKFYKILKSKYYSGNKILNKNEKLLNKIYHLSPNIKNKINLIKKQKNNYSLRDYQAKLFNNIKSSLSYKTNIKLKNDFYKIRKSIFVPNFEENSFQYLFKIENKEKEILDKFNNIGENSNSKIKYIDIKDDKLRPIKFHLKSIKLKRIIHI